MFRGLLNNPHFASTQFKIKIRQVWPAKTFEIYSKVLDSKRLGHPCLNRYSHQLVIIEKYDVFFDIFTVQNFG